MKFPFAIDGSLAEAFPFELPEGQATVWSYSRLEKFEQCPYRYWLTYEQKPRIAELDAEAPQEGKAVHDVIHGVLTKKGDVKSLAEHAVRQSSLLDEEDADDVAEMARAFLDRFSPSGQVLSEQHYEAKVDGIWVQAYVDLLENMPHAVRVTDFKTDREKWKPSERMQLPLYAVVAHELFKKPVVIRNWFLRFKRNPALEEEAAPEMIVGAKTWLKNTVAAIEAARVLGEEAFCTRTGSHCKSCGAGLACVGFKQHYAHTGDDAAALASAVLRLEAAKNIAMAMLKKWVNTNGYVRVADEYFGYYLNDSVKVDDIQKFVKVLEGAGAKPWKYLSVLGSKLKTDYDTLKPLLDGIASPQKKAIFTHKNSLPTGKGETQGPTEMAS
ncbi:MAG: PD-(D/E)XK nuclease family protein [Firmicutes bacterium]|nr:PD-(D/E)XK nuclease family protein [Bacillota bacterium]